MVSEKIEILILKYLEGELNEGQINKLADEISEEEVKDTFLESIEINYLLIKKYTKLDSNQAYLDFISQVKSNNKEKNLRFTFNSLLKYAAIFVGIIGIAVFFKLIVLDKPESLSLQIPNEQITLQLDNGVVELIEQTPNERVIKESDKIKIKQVGERIVYKDNIEVDKLIYNTLNIPNGKKFQIQLSDGTLVFLNSGSHLRYPVKFLESEKREVFISGEAFFKVAKDANHPFIVNANSIQIEVLGTEFNVSNYDEYEDVNTVLISGSVKLSHSSTNESVEIVPGNLAAWSKNQNKFDVTKVDVNDYTDWIDGKLTFRDTPFKNIRVKLEKHYNVTIVNNNEILDDCTFNASFDVESIEEVVETFKRNFGIDYKIIDNKIVIN